MGHASPSSRFSILLSLCWFFALPVSAAPPIELAKLLAEDGDIDNNFGWAVDFDGDTAIVAARKDNGFLRGSAYIFIRNSDAWIQQAKLTPNDGSTDNAFGRSVAIDGDIALVGASLDNDEGVNSGAVYVFVRTGTIWTQEAKIYPNDIEVFEFGESLDLDDEVALIGAPGSRFPAPDGRSAAYLFKRRGTSWVQKAKLTTNNGHTADFFGSSVAINGKTALVGALGDGSNGFLSGAAYMFTRSGRVWSQAAKLLASDGTAGDEFGEAVALDGDTALIGAGWADDEVDSRGGAAYVFSRVGNTWNEDAKLTASDAVFFERFGHSVALSENVALIGAYQDPTVERYGSAYVFTRSGNSWIETSKLIASDAEESDFFGYSVSLSGGRALIGSVLDDDKGSDCPIVGCESGAAYIFDLGLIGNVTIDIMPRSSLNQIDPSATGSVWVAILSDGQIDPLQVDISTVRFGPGEAVANRSRVRDVNRDGVGDLLLRFGVADTAIACGDTEAILTGATYSGQAITGSDSIVTVNCD